MNQMQVEARASKRNPEVSVYTVRSIFSTRYVPRPGTGTMSET